MVVGWEGRGNEPTQADARLREVITGKEQNYRFRWLTYRNVRIGGVPTWHHRRAFRDGRGCLGSGGEPTGLLGQKGGGGISVGWGFSIVGLEGNCSVFTGNGIRISRWLDKKDTYRKEKI